MTKFLFFCIYLCNFQDANEPSPLAKSILDGLDVIDAILELKTPNRKRTSKEIDDSETAKVQKIDSNKEKLVDTKPFHGPPLPIILSPRSSPSKLMTPPKRQSVTLTHPVLDDAFRRPLTKMEENKDIRRAIELSTVEDTAICPPDVKEEGDNSLESPITMNGPREHRYRLHSVVSHYGDSTSSGHYVADVFRFDAGDWYRYDDTIVTKTTEEIVRGKKSQMNSYILMYVHLPLWEACQEAASTI